MEIELFVAAAIPGIGWKEVDRYLLSGRHKPVHGACGKNFPVFHDPENETRSSDVKKSQSPFFTADKIALGQPEEIEVRNVADVE